MFELKPSVFAVGDTYQIIVPSPSPTTMWVKIGDVCYYDDSNGILRSDTLFHKMTVPADELNEACEYTVCAREMINRYPYFSETGEVFSKSFTFRPVKSLPCKAYHISDAHNNSAGPIAAAKAYGDIDLLILNGDLPDHSGKIENFNTIYVISYEITRGEIPAVFSRGNHDMRGILAEHLADHTPTDCGRSYFTFRLGEIWGVVLDCGEDKPDTNEEYGNTVCCHDFRVRQSAFLKRIIKNSEREYAADGVKLRLVIAHNPFPEQTSPPFNIESEVYTEWCDLLRESVKPQLFLAGHVHALEYRPCGSERDHLGQPCDLVTASDPSYKDGYAGTGFEFTEAGVAVTYTCASGVIETYLIEY